MNKRSISNEELTIGQCLEGNSKRISLMSTFKKMLKKIQSPKTSILTNEVPTDHFKIEKITICKVEPKKIEQNFTRSFSFNIRRCFTTETVGESPKFIPPFRDELENDTETNLNSEDSLCEDSEDEDHPVLLQMMERFK
jgi:hypothetical protein